MIGLANVWTGSLVVIENLEFYAIGSAPSLYYGDCASRAILSPRDTVSRGGRKRPTYTRLPSTPRLPSDAEVEVAESARL
jgi:hypothetical protein